ncbi:tetratricopeptide repeat protein [Caulobacter sp. RL271]|uniref:Tetratricopeptide repeat protein n=1 Tax=Caulobacter segnis TaxID=88688 RepID=A0ABY4ZTW6_9CAUL|nr:tetratricopeptide repeat protein [Caulobacter segnis]USQ96110.1 tetratricopeptide repeat protein [Caulobacter segnis]
MHASVAKGPQTSILVACVLMVGGTAAFAQSTPAPTNLESASSEGSRYSVLSDALWAMGSDAVPEPVETARAAVAAQPNSAEAHLRLGLAISLETPRAVELVRREYEEALRLEPANPRAYALMGEFYSHEGDAEGVERTYQAWLALTPNDPKARVSHAVALARLERLPEADAELERSLALGPTPAAYMVKAMRGGSPDDVLANVDKALAAGGDAARIYHWRARTRWQWGQTDLALADVAKGLEYAPNSFRLRQLRGEINGGAGRYGLAIAEFDALVALQPGRPDLLNDRCWTRAKAGVELLKAKADCDAVVAGDPDRPEGLDSRGLVKLRLGDLAGAIADYDAALAQDPEMATSLFGRGVAKSWKGDKAGAEIDLDKARAVDPEVEKQFANFGVAP